MSILRNIVLTVTKLCHTSLPLRMSHFNSVRAAVAIGGKTLHKKLSKCVFILLLWSQWLSRGSQSSFWLNNTCFFFCTFHFQPQRVFHLHRLSGNCADTSAAGLGTVQLWPLVWCAKRKHLIWHSPSAGKLGERRGEKKNGKKTKRGWWSGRQRERERGSIFEIPAICSPRH